MMNFGLNQHTANGNFALTWRPVKLTKRPFHQSSRDYYAP